MLPQILEWRRAHNNEAKPSLQFAVFPVCFFLICLFGPRQSILADAGVTPMKYWGVGSYLQCTEVKWMPKKVNFRVPACATQAAILQELLAN